MYDNNEIAASYFQFGIKAKKKAVYKVQIHTKNSIYISGQKNNLTCPVNKTVTGHFFNTVTVHF